MRAARQGQGEGAEQEAERQPEPEGEHVHLARGAVRVPEEGGDLGEAADRRQDPDPVTHLQLHVVEGEQLHVAAPHAGDHRVEPALEVELAERTGRDLRVRDEDAAQVELAPVEVDPLLHGRAQPFGDARELARRPDDGDEVRGTEPGLVRHERGDPVSLEPPEDHAPAQPPDELLHRERADVLRDAHGDVGERLVGRPQLGEPPPLARQVGPEHPQPEEDGQDDADDPLGYAME